MLKFMVVLVGRDGMSSEEFRRFFKEIHEPLAKKIPGLKRYVQNFVLDDPRRKRPEWDAIIELYFEDWAAMEAGWASAEGQEATNDLAAFAALDRSGWSVVEEIIVQ